MGPTMAEADILLSSAASRRLTEAIFAAAGSDAPEANAIAEGLVEANLTGHDSHGVGMIPRYIGELLKAKVVPNRHIEIVSRQGPILQADGGMGYGLAIGIEAMARAKETAEREGLALLGLRNSYHLGRIGRWAEICAEAGYVSLHFVNVIGHAPYVAPFGAAEARFATNPFCAGFPAAGSAPPVILDMATSAVAHGKVRVAHNRREPMADDCLLTHDGQPSNDPGVMFAEPMGAIRAFGAHKGSGLAIVCELLAGALVNGGTCLPETFERDTIVNNMLSILIAPAALGDPQRFAMELAGMAAEIRGARPVAGVERVRMPGDPEREGREIREREGIPIDPETWRQILEAAAAVGLPEDRVEAIAGA